jgi:hypothetical protein
MVVHRSACLLIVGGVASDDRSGVGRVDGGLKLAGVGGILEQLADASTGMGVEMLAYQEVENVGGGVEAVLIRGSV